MMIKAPHLKAVTRKSRQTMSTILTHAVLSHMCIIYLWDRVLVERDVFACHAGQIEGNDVAHSLDFMDDCISIGHVIPITHRGLSG